MLTRYFVKETLLPFFYIATILTVLLITSELALLIELVIEGRYEESAIYRVLGMYVPMLLPDVIPPAYLLALLITLSRFSQDNERTIVIFAGVSEQSLLLKLLLFTALPITLVLAALTLFASPYYTFQFETYRVEQLNRPITSLIEPGEFFPLPESKGLLFINASTPATNTLEGVFVIQRDESQTNIVLSNTATTSQGDTLYLTFSDGQIYSLGEESTRQGFTDYAFKLPNTPKTYDNLKLSGMSTAMLWETNSNWRKSELIYRIIYPFIVPVLCIWALGLTQTKPRQGKVGAIAIGIGLFILYSFLTRSVHATVVNGKTPLWADFWWMHLAAAAIGWVWFFGRQRT